MNVNGKEVKIIQIVHTPKSSSHFAGTLGLGDDGVVYVDTYDRDTSKYIWKVFIRDSFTDE